MSIIIKDVREPYYSSKQLANFETTYGFTSEYFYDHYQQGEILIKDEYAASEWAFEYEINRRAKEEELKERSNIRQSKCGDPEYGSSLLYNDKEWDRLVNNFESNYIYKSFRTIS